MYVCMCFLSYARIPRAVQLLRVGESRERFFERLGRPTRADLKVLVQVLRRRRQHPKPRLRWRQSRLRWRPRLRWRQTASCALLGSTLQAKAIAVPFSPLRLGHIAVGSLGMHEHFGTSITRVIWLRTRSKALHSTCILTVILSSAPQTTQFINIYFFGMFRIKHIPCSA